MKHDNSHENSDKTRIRRYIYRGYSEKKDDRKIQQR